MAIVKTRRLVYPVRVIKIAVQAMGRKLAVLGVGLAAVVLLAFSTVGASGVSNRPLDLTPTVYVYLPLVVKTSSPMSWNA